MSKYKSFIIGCGKIAGLYDDDNDKFIYSHAKAYADNDKIDIAGCCDIKINNSKILAEKYNIDVYECQHNQQIRSISDSLFKVKPDIVSICTPDTTHFDIVISILESKYTPKVIFLEKPVCQNQNQFKRIINASEAKGVKVVVNHSRRFDEHHNNLKKQIQKNIFGRLVKIDAIYYSGWQHNGTHLVDTLHYLFNDELLIESLMNEFDSPYKGDKNLDFKCRFRKNKALVYLTTMDESYYQLFEYDLKFEKARIRIEDFGFRVHFEKKIVNNMSESVLMKSAYPIDISVINSPMKSAISKIVDYLEVGSTLEGYLLEDVYKTMQLIWQGRKWTR